VGYVKSHFEVDSGASGERLHPYLLNWLVDSKGISLPIDSRII